MLSLPQSSEKYLKGFLALHGRKIVKTHNLVSINSSCIEIDERFNDISEQCSYLTDFSSTIRYPFPLDLTEEDTDQAIRYAKIIQGFVLNKTS